MFGVIFSTDWKINFIFTRQYSFLLLWTIIICMIFSFIQLLPLKRSINKPVERQSMVLILWNQVIPKGSPLLLKDI